jgi:hypothetical protein
MNVDDLNKLSDDELRRRAGPLLAELDSGGGGLHGARFYLEELTRRQEDRAARSRHRREDILAFVELALTVIITILIVHEISQAAESIKLSRDNIQIANDGMKEAAKQTASLKQMKEALSNQLKILNDEQTRQLEEQSKRPELKLYTGAGLSLKKAGVSVSALEFTPTKAIYELVLRNTGRAPAINIQLRIITDNQVTIATDVASEEVRAPAVVASAGRARLVTVDRLGVNTWVTIKLTLEYTAGKEFSVEFNADADRFPRTRLGGFKVSSLKAGQ